MHEAEKNYDIGWVKTGGVITEKDGYKRWKKEASKIRGNVSNTRF